MKKLFTLSAIVACSFLATNTATGQTVLATYEQPMGQEAITETVFCETPPKAFVTFTGVVANPVKDETMNNTNNCYMVQEGAEDWWANFLNFRMTNPITITEANRYLHVLHYRQKLNDSWMVCLNVDWPLADADKGKLRFDAQNSKEGVWEDVVIDLKYLIDNAIPLTKFMFGVSMDWNGVRDNPSSAYYFDEIILNNNPLPRGVNILADNEMSLFVGNTASYNKWVGKYDLQHAENTSAIIANPFTTETAVLNSTQVMQYNKSANASWWQGGPRFKFPGIFQVGKAGASSYLHAMVNIPQIETGKDYYIVQLNAKDFSGKQLDSGDSQKYWADDKGKWIDMVLDVTSLGFVSEFTVRFDVRRDATDALINSPAGVFYFDAAAIDNSEAPRTVVNAPTAVVTPSTKNVKVFSSNRNLIIEGDVALIEVYNTTGKSISKTPTHQFRTELPVSQAGFYLIKTISTNGEVSNSKLFVK
jgi:hypothetical protein